MIAKMFHMILMILSASDIIPDDFVAEYHQNSMHARTIRIQWTHTDIPNADSHRRYLMHSRSVFEKEVKNLNLSQLERDAAKEQIRHLDENESNSGKLAVRHAQFDLWTDRVNFQIRSPCNQKKGGPFFYGQEAVNWVAMPDAEVSSENLAEAFKEIWITSWRPAKRRVFITWEGRQVANRYGQGLITATLLSGVVFPPLSSPLPEWGGTMSLIDEFFSDGSTHARVLGNVVIDGVDTIAVERRWAQGKINRILVGYIDPAKGCLPRRIEVYSAGSEVPLEQKWRTPCQLSKIIKGEHFPLYVLKNVVVESEGGIYYPKSGVVDQYIPIGVDIDSEIVVYSAASWDIQSVEWDRPMPEEMFSFTYPTETLFVDQTKNEILLTGNADEAAKRIVGGMVPQSKSENRAAWMLFGIGLLCLLTLLGYFRWRKAS